MRHDNELLQAVKSYGYTCTCAECGETFRSPVSYAIYCGCDDRMSISRIVCYLAFAALCMVIPAYVKLYRGM